MAILSVPPQQALHGVFFAIGLPLSAAAAAITARDACIAAEGLPTTRGLIAPQRLHVTLHSLGLHADAAPLPLVQRAKAAGAQLQAEPFGVVFDRIGSPGNEEHGGLMLMGGDGLAGLRRLQRTLAAAMTDAGIGSFVRTRFNPHVSLLYADRRVEPRAIEPVRWQVDELLLIDSWQGHSRHDVLARWPLVSPQQGFAGW